MKSKQVLFKSQEKEPHSRINIEEKIKQSPFKIFSILKQEKMQKSKEDSNEDINPMDELIKNLTNDKKALKSIDYSDEKIIEKLFLEKEKQCIINRKKIAFVEVIYYALKKNKKTDNDLLILKLFFMNMEKFISLLLPLKVNLNDLLIRLMSKMKCEKKNKDSILFRAGDIGQKLYILLKGHVGVVIKKDKTIECTPFEFIKYLIVLHLFHEDYLMSEIIDKNKNIINIEEEKIINLFQIFKIFNFLKQNQRLKEDYKSIFDFAQNDLKFKKFFENKYNYPPVIALDISTFKKTGVEQLYEFYSRKINFMNKNLKTGLRGSDLFASFIKRQMNDSGIIKPTSQQELLVYLRPYDEGTKTFKNEEEYYLKILSVNEISADKINKTSVEDYIKHLDPDMILNDIRIDEKSINHKILDKDKIIQNNIIIKTFFFVQINQMYDGSIFGELALTNPNSKRTATIITKTDCYFGTIIKQYYDLSFRAAQEKSQMRNIAFFIRSPIFKGINQGIFLNKFYFLFKKRAIKNGDVLYKRGKERKSAIFIIKGELELRALMTLSEIGEIINILGGILENKYLRDLMDTYEEFKRYYSKHKHNIKLCVLKDREILGFDDMVINGINMFDCVCISSDKTEVYELDYSHIKEAKKYEKIINNINSFVNMKRKLFIKILLEQRNTIIINEMGKIRKKRKQLNEPKKCISISAKNNKYLTNKSKENINNNKLILSYKEKQKEEYNFTFDKKKSKNIIKIDKSPKNKKILTNSSFKDSKTIKINMKNKEEDIDQILTSFKYNTGNKFIVDMRERSKTFRSKNNKKNNEENSKIAKNNILKIKKNFFFRNPILFEDIFSNSTKSKLIPNQTYKPLINNICIYRTRKNIIPNSHNSKQRNKKSSLSPYTMKEYQKPFTEKINMVYINNFYFQRQKIFDKLLDEFKEITNDNRRIQSSTSRKMKFSNTQIDFSVQEKEQKNFNEKIKMILRQDNKHINRMNQTHLSKLNLQKNSKKKIGNRNGFIDFLCLDNWEEKENFEKRFLSENNKNM